MPISTPDSQQPAGRLQDVVIAFDIDNTLLDADPSAYRRTVTDFLSFADTGLDAEEAFHAYEKLRSQGDALERLGLLNPIHHRGSAETLAVFCMNHCKSKALLHDLDIKPVEQRLSSRLVAQTADLVAGSRQGSLADRLPAEIKLRHLCSRDERAQQFRETIRRIAGHPLVSRWARTYRDIESRQSPVGDFRPLLGSLSSMGATLVVLSEGRKDVQRAKLDRLGLTDRFERHVLVTETATDIPGADELDAAISQRIAAEKSPEELSNDPELLLLWYYRSLIDTWEKKTPSFFARCLHAVFRNPNAPDAALSQLTFVPRDEWREKPLRLVMIGDRYDKDVLPLIELLGSGVGLTIRLVRGKYSNRDAENELPPERRPSRTFGSWDSLAEFLTGGLSADEIKPIIHPPDVFPRTDLHRDRIEQGLHSAYEAVRHIAHIAVKMLSQH